MNYGSTTSETAITLFTKTIQTAATFQSDQTTAIQDKIIHEASELYNLQTQTNSSLLEFGLNLGFIERRPIDGRLTIESLNVFPSSSRKLFERLMTEFVLRLGMFIPATSLVNIAIQSNPHDPDREDALRCVYIFSILLHQIVNYDKTSVRTINRLLVCVAIILFSLTTTNSKPCNNMESFKKKIRTRLLVDYYLWTITLAMSYVLTCTSPLYINLELTHGIEMHTYHTLVTVFCVMHLCINMRLIGYGRLAPLIEGTSLLFLDAGDDITPMKCAVLFLLYLRFWASDWRELVDWNHSMLCEAGICELLNEGTGKLSAKVEKAKRKFDDWRLEEGMDDDGWFILLDAPARGTTTFRAPNESSSDGTNSVDANTTHSDDQINRNTGGNNEQNQTHSDSDEIDQENDDENSEEEDDDDDDDDAMNGQQVIDSERVIYLQSRNPLLTSLAIIILVLWK